MEGEGSCSGAGPDGDAGHSRSQEEGTHLEQGGSVGGALPTRTSMCEHTPLRETSGSLESCPGTPSGSR